MDENLTKEEHTKQTTKEYPMCANHPLMKTLFIGFLIFAGAYCNSAKRQICCARKIRAPRRCARSCA